MTTNDPPSEIPPGKASQNYLEARESRLARHEIDLIARDLNLPAEEIAETYAQLYADLKSRARVTDYLRVFVSRKVRARYRSTQAS